MISFINTIAVEMTKGNFSFFILVVGIAQLLAIKQNKNN